MSKVFLLSPASVNGRRTEFLLNPKATFDLAARLHRGGTVTLGEVFSFLSGLYFRGKMAYAGRFGEKIDGMSGSFVITTDRGLAPPETNITLNDLQAFRESAIHPENAGYIQPLERDVRLLAESNIEQIVLLGSIATGKYVDVLHKHLGDRLQFPVDFTGRGDLSRGGLMLRAAATGEELQYGTVTETPRHGARPVRLEKYDHGRTSIKDT